LSAIVLSKGELSVPECEHISRLFIATESVAFSLLIDKERSLQGAYRCVDVSTDPDKS
jgi:hypothetical protein